MGDFVKAIETAEFLNEEQKQDIYFDNTIRFFGFDL